MTSILAINGALSGATGNTARALADAAERAPPGAVLRHLVLASLDGATVDDVVAKVRAADALLLGTGNYWGSWGSPMQRFLEVMSAWEATDVFLGKPVGVVVTMESVGGSDVAARLLSAFGLLGCTTPPFPMVVLSRLGSTVAGDAGFSDVWQRADLGPLVQNLAVAAGSRPPWAVWPVEPLRHPTGRYPSVDALALGPQPF